MRHSTKRMDTRDHRRRRFGRLILDKVANSPILTVKAAFFLLLTTAPVFAQVDFSGEWAPRFYEDQPERVPGPELGDYLGIPINEAGRMRGDTWDASVQTLPEC